MAAHPFDGCVDEGEGRAVKPLDLVVFSTASQRDGQRLTVVTPERAREHLYTGPHTTLHSALEKAGFKAGDRVRLVPLVEPQEWEGNPS